LHTWPRHIDCLVVTSAPTELYETCEIARQISVCGVGRWVGLAVGAIVGFPAAGVGCVVGIATGAVVGKPDP
jgi:hypothetical protein